MGGLNFDRESVPWLRVGLMPTLLTSKHLDIRILFSESLADVAPILQTVIRQRESILLVVGADRKRARVVNLAQVPEFTLDVFPESEIDSLDTDGGPDTVVVSALNIEVRE